MRITQADRDNYQLLRDTLACLAMSMDKVRGVMDESIISTMIRGASQGLVGRKDVVYFQQRKLVPASDKETATLKLSHLGWMIKSGYSRRGWRAARNYDLVHSISGPEIQTALGGFKGIRNPKGLQDLAAMLDEVRILKEELKGSFKWDSRVLQLPVPATLGNCLVSNTDYLDGQIKSMCLLLEGDWRSTIQLRVNYTIPNSIGSECGTMNLHGEPNFIAISEPDIFPHVLVLLAEAEAYTKQLYVERAAPLELFKEKYGQYLVLKQL